MSPPTPPTKEDKKAERGHKKQAVSLRIRNLRLLIAEADDPVAIEAKAKELKTAFSELATVCDEYVALLDAKAEQTEVEDAESYIEKAEKDYVSALQTFNNFIEKSKKSLAPTSPSKTQLSTSSTTPEVPPINVTVAAPAAAQASPVFVECFKPEPFDGSPLKFPMWKASMDAYIDSLGPSASFSTKMFHLQTFVKGEARSAIESCFLVPNEKSYEQAWSILTERFGSSVLVTTAFREKIESWPRVAPSDKKALQAFSDFLLQVHVASLTYTSLAILDDQFENKKLVAKIPTWLATKWITKVVNQANFPKFKEFSDFISTYAKISNHVLWGSSPSAAAKPSTKSANVAQTGSSSSRT